MRISAVHGPAFQRACLHSLDAPWTAILASFVGTKSVATDGASTVTAHRLGSRLYLTDYRPCASVRKPQ